jgi:hypothetical protein
LSLAEYRVCISFLYNFTSQGNGKQVTAVHASSPIVVAPVTAQATAATGRRSSVPMQPAVVPEQFFEEAHFFSWFTKKKYRFTGTVCWCTKNHASVTDLFPGVPYFFPRVYSE